MLLELKEVKVNYGGARILKGVSLGVEEGDIVCLIGANGAGKTTALRTISGLKKPRAGQIIFAGTDISRIPPPDILALGVVQVPQEGRLWADMSVYDNLRVGAHLRRDKKGIKKDLEMVFGYFPILAERARLRAGSLSGGERQMLATARALMSKPKLLMMDEPTAGLAPKMVDMIAEIILKLHQEGICILLVEQNAELALSVARYGYVLERGLISLKGSTEELRDNQQVKQAYLGM